ncbi:MAG: hypothetical protein JWP85_587 [Rhodoglobus sp.]|nr:hypothetical protein [Rhodoglobus sp.]
MSTADTSSIHRYLDDAFAGVPVTPESQDLKEELRGNLAVRVSELLARGMDAPAAAATAVEELGDIRPLLDSLAGGGAATGKPAPLNHATAAAHYRVRPKPGFVVRTVVLCLVLLAGAIILTLDAVHAVSWESTTLMLAVALGVALSVGLIVADSLQQETTQHYPVRRGRAVLFGAAATLGALGLGLTAVFLGDLQLWLLIAGVALALAALVGFVWLGVTQTNRTKPWVLTMYRDIETVDRFTEDPVAAARFGLYTVIIWTLVLAAFVVLSITIGFAWSWLAIVLGIVVFMFVLARMLFPEKKDK